MATILVIDDELDILQLIKAALEKENHLVITREKPTLVSPKELQRADLILLDVMMPEVDGFTYCQEIRQQVDVPILFLTAKTMEQDMLTGFASGADDFLTKPFSLVELRARVGVHLRRETREKVQRLVEGPVSLDLIANEFYVNGQLIELTPAEYKICELLFKNHKQTFSKESLYEHLYGFEGTGDSQTILPERIKNIRRKFKQVAVEPIQTVWGIGYKWQRLVSDDSSLII